MNTSIILHIDRK